jgi:colicin import membrane protein
MVVRVQARWRIKKCGLALGLLRCARAAADAEAKAAEAAAAAAAAKAEAEAEAAAEVAAEVAAEAAAEAAAAKAAAEAAEELRSFQASLAGEGVCVLKHRPKGAPQEKLLSGAPPFAQLLWSDCAKGKKKGKAKAVALGAGWKVVESARESTGGAPPGSKASASAAGSSSSSATATVTVEGRDRSLTLSAAPGSAAMTAPRLAANLRALLRAHLGPWRRSVIDSPGSGRQAPDESPRTAET